MNELYQLQKTHEIEYHTARMKSHSIIAAINEETANINRETAKIRFQIAQRELRDATQNDPQIFDMVKSPDPPSKNMEEESVSSGELQSIPEYFQ